MNDAEQLRKHLINTIIILKERANKIGILPTEIIIHHKLLDILRKIKYE